MEFCFVSSSVGKIKVAYLGQPCNFFSHELKSLGTMRENEAGNVSR